MIDFIWSIIEFGQDSVIYPLIEGTDRPNNYIYRLYNKIIDMDIGIISDKVDLPK